MLRFLLQRPIAVSMSFLALLIFSLISYTQLPVSLLPDIEVPQILIHVKYPNASPAEIEENVLRPIRENMLTLDGLSDIESKAGNESGTIKLLFEYGESMNLAYVNVNEKMDRLTSRLPRDLDRPQIVRLSTSDIPVLRIQVVPDDEGDITQLTELTEKVLKKRLEQLEGISLVDLNGRREESLLITPDQAALQAYGVSEQQLVSSIQANTSIPGALSVRDGQYRYYLKMASEVREPEQVKEIPIRLASGDVVMLNKVASVKQAERNIQGFHLFNQAEGLVISVHKQSHAQMTRLVPEIYQVVDEFKADYPHLRFNVTQDQSLMLESGIENLKISLFSGGLFAFVVLFFFMRNYRLPLIIGISLPVSLVISFLVFYLTGLSINIISLSGLALGLGMLIDNSIIVLDQINRKRAEGNPILTSCVKGVHEVMAPLISSVLTTLAVFVPLIFMNGLSGALFFDQALSVAIVLSISLIVSFILLPLIYRLIFSASNKLPEADSLPFRIILSGYKWLFEHSMRHRTATFAIIFTLIPLSAFVFLRLDTDLMPPVEKKESLMRIEWNEPIDVLESRKRTESLLSTFRNDYVWAESDIGVVQFLLEQENRTAEQAVIYFLFKSTHQRTQVEHAIEKWMQKYPLAKYHLKDAPNAFDQLFNSNRPYFEARWSDMKFGTPLPNDRLYPILKDLKSHPLDAANLVIESEGMSRTTSANLLIDKKALEIYEVEQLTLQEKLRQLFSEYKVTELKDFGNVLPVIVENSNKSFRDKLNYSQVLNTKGIPYPLSRFVQVQFVQDNKHLTADRTGLYKALIWPEIKETDRLTDYLKSVAVKHGLRVTFTGDYLEQRNQIKQLFHIMLISIALLYFILSAQFESFLQPLIVLFTLPLGIGGSLILMGMTDTSLNVMSSIGMVVMLGIMVNDAILKVETMNKLYANLRKEKKEVSRSQRKEWLRQVIREAGYLRLKPILMTSLTTILALLPVLFTSGTGSDLQRPLVIAVIGGLTIGTFTALFFVPLAYSFIKR